jgi:hypothetical protein
MRIHHANYLIANYPDDQRIFNSLIHYGLTVRSKSHLTILGKIGTKMAYGSLK